MKKLLIPAVFILFFAFCAVFSCRLSDDDDDTLSSPSVENSSTDEGGVIVARENYGSATEVFVYRINTSDKKAEPVHVGSLFPKNISQSILTFPDPLVYTGSTYKYRFLYIDSDSSKTWTDWSSEIEVTSGKKVEDISTMTYAVDSDTVLGYSPENYTLQFISKTGGSINITDLDSTNFAFLGNFEPCIVLKTSESQAAFPLSDDVFSGTDPIYLKNSLPLDFYDTKIACTGILGKYAVTNKDGKTTYIYWTEPASITLYNTISKKEISDFTVSAQGSEGVVNY